MPPVIDDCWRWELNQSLSIGECATHFGYIPILRVLKRQGVQISTMNVVVAYLINMTLVQSVDCFDRKSES